MADLRTQLSNLGYENIQTYIQSGNVIFENKKTVPELLAAQITSLIKKVWDYDVPVIVFEPDYLEKVIEENPFFNGRNEDVGRLYVTFLAEKPASENVQNLESYSYPPEELIVKNTAVYLFCPNGYGKTKYDNNFVERKLKVTATTRNWKTCNKLLEMTQG